MNLEPIATIYVAALIAAVMGTGQARAEEPDMSQHQHHQHAIHADKHANHVMPQGVKRSLAGYSLPDVSLTGTNGKAVRLADELDSQAPVLVNFIFTSCTAICPLTTAVFAQVQERLVASGKPFRLISISIDPEQDTPARLKEYASKFGAGANWHFLTGDTASVLEVQRAFKAWRGGKMNHAPITYLRAAPGTPWVRYEGLVDAETLVEDYLRYTTGLKTVWR